MLEGCVSGKQEPGNKPNLFSLFIWLETQMDKKVLSDHKRKETWQHETRGSLDSVISCQTTHNNQTRVKNKEAGSETRVFVTVWESGVTWSRAVVFIPGASLSFFLGRDSGNPPKTQSEAPCQRLHTLASRMFQTPAAQKSKQNSEFLRGSGCRARWGMR